MGTTYTLSGDLGTLIGASAASIHSAYVRTNLPAGRALVDTTATANSVRLGLGRIPIANTGGPFEVELLGTANTGLNVPANTLRYEVLVEFANPGQRGIQTWSSGFFELTADVDIKDVVLDAEPAAVASASGFAQDAAASADAAEEFLAQTQAVALGDAEDVLAGAIVNPGPVRDNLNITIATETADKLDASDLPALAAAKWQPTTAYAAGVSALSPAGVLVQAKAAFTSGATYDPSKWRTVSLSNDWVGNLSDTSLQNWQWGTSERLHIAFYGDSITQGAWAGLTELTDWDTLGFVGLFRQALQRIYGNGGLGFVGLFRKEWVKAGTWAQVADYAPFGQCWSATANTATYTLTTKAGDGDNVDVFYVDTSAAFTYKIDGGSAVTIPATGSPTNATVKTNIALPSDGVHTLQIIGPASGILYLVGAAIYKGTTGLVVHNIAKSGALIGDMGFSTGSSTTRTHIVGIIKPRLNIVGFMANDYTGQTALATYNTRLGYLLDKAIAQGDTMLWLPPDNNNAELTITEAQYRAEAKALAVSKGIPWADVLALWGPPASNVPKYHDNLHPNALGHRSLAAEFLKLVRRIA